MNTEDQLREQLTSERRTRVRGDLQRSLERRGLSAEAAELRALKSVERVTFAQDGTALFGDLTGDAALEALSEELAADHSDPVAEGKAMAKKQRPGDNSLAFR
jgi:hypothetical protein